MTMSSSGSRGMSPEVFSALATWTPGLTLRLNMVLDETGAYQDDTGTSRDLSNDRDRQLLRAIRRDADALLTGASSVRAEGWFPIPNGPTLVLTAGRAPLPPAPENAVTELVRLPTFDRDALAGLCRAVATRGARRILSEGGATLATALLDADVVTDVNLTIRTRSAEQATELARGRFPELRKFTIETVANDATHTFMRWRCATAATGLTGTILTP